MMLWKNLTKTSTAFAALSLFVINASCSNSGKNDAAASPALPNVSTNSQGNGAATSDATKQGRIVLTLSDKWTNLTGYVVGNAQHAVLQKIVDQNGKPGFINMSSGIYDLVVEGQQTAADGKISPVALRISGVKVADGADTPIRDVELVPYVNLSGAVNFEGEGGLAGVTVSITGTPLQATTSLDGSYTLKVPVGNHALSLASAGYSAGFVGTKPYRGDEQIPTLTLVKDSNRLDIGAHYLGETLPANSTHNISLQLVAPTGMTHFRYVASSSDFIINRPWLVLQSSLEIDLPTGEHPEVTLQFSLDQRQLSPTYPVIIPVSY
ncbi:MAG: hypothetical protein H7249_15335 [Chitinophagaceae bacterium]|nr:hypothetical protein [Oligoflexus sp.]